MSRDSVSANATTEAMATACGSSSTSERANGQITSGSSTTLALTTIKDAPSRETHWWNLAKYLPGNLFGKKHEDIKRDVQIHAIETAKQMEIDRRNHVFRMEQLALERQRLCHEHEKTMGLLEKDVENDRQIHELKMGQLDVERLKVHEQLRAERLKFEEQMKVEHLNPQAEISDDSLEHQTETSNDYVNFASSSKTTSNEDVNTLAASSSSSTNEKKRVSDM